MLWALAGKEVQDLSMLAVLFWNERAEVYTSYVSPTLMTALSLTASIIKWFNTTEIKLLNAKVGADDHSPFYLRWLRNFLNLLWHGLLSSMAFLTALSPSLIASLIWVMVWELGPLMTIVTEWGSLQSSTNVNLSSPLKEKNKI